MKNNNWWLLAVIVIATCYFAECDAADPSIYVKIQFSFTWIEMCNLGDYLKENIAKQIVMDDNTGGTLPTNKVVLYNFNDNCRPKGTYEKANVYIFASKVANNNDPANIDETMTKKIYKVVNYLYEQKLERYLGSLFIGKIESVDLAGKNAPAKSTAYTEVERLYIGLGVALIIIVLILVISVLVVFFKNRKNKDENKTSRYAAASRNKESNSAAARMNLGLEASRNEVYNDEDNRGHSLQTRF